MIFLQLLAIEEENREKSRIPYGNTIQTFRTPNMEKVNTMKKVITAITVIGALALAIPASAFNVTIAANDDNSPWAVMLGGAWAPGKWAPWQAASTQESDVPTGSYNWTGKWAHFHGAVTFDVDGSGLVQNIQPSWGANGEGTSTMNITGPEVAYGFFGNFGSLVGINGPGHYGWVGADNVTTGIWPKEGGRPYTWRHTSSGNPPGLPEMHYLSFAMNSDGKVHDFQPETGGSFAIDGTGKATIDTSGEAIDIGGSYVQGDAELNSASAAMDAAVLAQFNALNSNLAAVEAKLDNLPSGPQGPQGTAGADGANGSDGSQGPQGKVGANGADGADAPCVDCQTISDAAFDLACIQLEASPATTVSDFQSSVDAIATVSIVGSGNNICEPIPGGAATCMDYINDQAQAIYDSKTTP